MPELTTTKTRRGRGTREPVPAELVRLGAQPLSDPRRERFVQGLHRGLSRAEAYERAGYESRNPVAAANQMLRRADVSCRLAWLEEQAARRVGIERAAILAREQDIAETSITDFVQWDGEGRVRVVPSDQLPPERRAAIKSLVMRPVVRKVTREAPEGAEPAEDGKPPVIEEEVLDVVVHKFELEDRQKANRMLGEANGTFRGDVPQRPIQVNVLAVAQVQAPQPEGQD